MTEDRSRIERIRYEPKVRTASVVALEPQGENFLGVTFASPDFVDFESASFDDHVKFIFPAASGELLRRDFTPRRYDRAARTLRLEFALHEAGPSSDWARRASVGQEVTIAGPRGSMVVPMDYDWHLLAGDDSALPAIRRRLEELPAGAAAIVVLLSDLAAPVDPATTAARLTLHRFSTAGEWLAGLQQVGRPAGSGFAWCAGEASLMAEVRRLWLAELGLSRQDTKIAAYWKRGTADFHERISQPPAP
jgi:NADPH-dependent ferric siderophore reductase